MSGESSQPVMFVTGGSGSIGSEIAREALAAGWAVIVQGRRQSTVAAVTAALAAEIDNAPVRPLVCDIMEQGVDVMVAEAAALFGRLDAVVDCLVTGPVSGGIIGGFATTNPDNYSAFAEFSIVYLERLAFACLPWLKQSRGSLTTFVSDAGVFAAPRQVLLGAARAAAIGFVRNLALDVARDGVRVNGISPGFVDETAVAKQLAETGGERLEKARRRAGLGLPTPRDIAPLALFLSGSGARRITGQVISVNGGVNA